MLQLFVVSFVIYVRTSKAEYQDSIRIPTQLNVTCRGDEIKLQWETPSSKIPPNLERYLILVSPDDREIKVNATTKHFSLKNVIAGQKYTVTVHGYMQEKILGKGNAKQFTIPFKPVITNVVSSLHGAEVYFSTHLFSINFCRAKNVNGSQDFPSQRYLSTGILKLDNLQPQSKFNVAVICCNDYCCSKDSNPYLFDTYSPKPDFPPSNVKLLKLNDTAIHLQWEWSGGKVSYFKVIATPSINVGTVKKNTTKTELDLQVTPGVNYTILIFACSLADCGPKLSYPFVQNASLNATSQPISRSNPVAIHSTTETIYIIVGSVAVCCLIIFVVFWVKSCRRQNNRDATVTYHADNGSRDSRTMSSVNNDYTPMKGGGSALLVNRLQRTLGDVLIEEKNLSIGALLGEGEFGYVYKGKLTFTSKNDPDKSTDVAVKSIKAIYRTAEETEEIVKEGLRMKEFNHPNVMGLIGICLSTFIHPEETWATDVSPLVVLPFMPHGDLKSHLFLSRSSGNCGQFNLKRLLQFALDIASGMEYLSEKNFVHRDLAARNCMINKNNSVVVSDFGLSRKLYSANYYRQTHTTKLPVKWMALESLADNVFTSKSDVWSFGVTFWEILTFCQAPYPGIANHEVYDYLRRGMRLMKPSYCSEEMWHKLVYPCWNPQAKERITFSEVVTRIRQYIGSPNEELFAPIKGLSSSFSATEGYEEPIPVVDYNLAEDAVGSEQNKTENYPLINNGTRGRVSNGGSLIVSL